MKFYRARVSDQRTCLSLSCRFFWKYSRFLWSVRSSNDGTLRSSASHCFKHGLVPVAPCHGSGSCTRLGGSSWKRRPQGATVHRLYIEKGLLQSRNLMNLFRPRSSSLGPIVPTQVLRLGEPLVAGMPLHTEVTRRRGYPFLSTI